MGKNYSLNDMKNGTRARGGFKGIFELTHPSAVPRSCKQNELVYQIYNKISVLLATRPARTTLLYIIINKILNRIAFFYHKLQPTCYSDVQALKFKQRSFI